MEVYIVMNICFYKGPLIRGGCDLKVQQRPEKQTELRWQHCGLFQLSLKSKR